MLKHLLIKNYALIKHLEITPSPRLNVITGETGAGKSIMLGAIGLLLGDRADTKVLLNEGEKCLVEGSFSIEGYGLEELFQEADLDFQPQSIIRREVSPLGKSRAFINDTPVTLETLRRITSRLMDIHSQHDTLLLAADDFQRSLLDHFAQNQSLRKTYQQAYHTWRKAEQDLQNLRAQAETLHRQADYNQYLLQELQRLPLEKIHQESMEQQLEWFENLETVRQQLAVLIQLLADNEPSAETLVRNALSEVRKIAPYAPAYQTFAERLENLLIELRDLVSEIENQASELFFDQEQAQLLRSQLDLLYLLQKKHNVSTVEELVAIRNRLAEQVNWTLHLEEAIAAAEKNVHHAHNALREAAEALSQSRRQASMPLAEQVNALLKELGMSNARLEIVISPTAPSPQGADAVSFLFSANKGIRPEPLKNVASGGEFSRLMLCLKYVLAGKTALPTIIFDEIDTGISGEIAIKVSKMLREMSRNHQLFVISHLPQTAANGDRHYYVYKQDTDQRAVSCIRQLSYQERLHEIAQMIGGANPSEHAYQSAKELMELYQ
ncbi:MAG: DNA repair protein RecN [Cytophagales bacterium]|nr:DNA repair protein RecN [Bernardetiaceae bacterium]MDW8211590.1 DNA repair protein RecN [Cytophagales bacterium]